MKCFNELQLETRSKALLLVNEYQFFLAKQIGSYLDLYSE
jgi:hypothetical protein